MLRKNKIIFVLLVVLFVLSFLNFPVFGSVYEYNGNQVELPDINFNHYLVFEGNGTYYLMVLDDVYIDNGYVCMGGNGSYGYCRDTKTWEDSKKIPFSYYTLDGDVWLLETNEANWTHAGLGIMYSTEDVYLRGEVFFQKTPETVEEVQETTLAKITRESRPEETLLQIVKILPLILVVVVSLVGFRKAWRLLSSILHRA